MGNEYWVQFRYNHQEDWLSAKAKSRTPMHAAQSDMNAWLERNARLNPDLEWRWHPDMFLDLGQ